MKSWENINPSQFDSNFFTIVVLNTLLEGCTYTDVHIQDKPGEKSGDYYAVF